MARSGTGAADGEDDWGDTSVSKEKMMAAAKAKLEENKQAEEDDWGDLQVTKADQEEAAAVSMKMDNLQINMKDQEEDWGIITPAPPKKKKVEDIGVKSRKQEGPDEEDDEWGDTTSTKF